MLIVYKEVSRRTHMDVVCVDTLITGSAKYQIIDHLRETMRNLNLNSAYPPSLQSTKALCKISAFVNSPACSFAFLCNPTLLIPEVKFPPTGRKSHCQSSGVRPHLPSCRGQFWCVPPVCAAAVRSWRLSRWWCCRRSRPAGSSGLPPVTRPDSSRPAARGTPTQPSACLSGQRIAKQKWNPLDRGDTFSPQNYPTQLNALYDMMHLESQKQLFTPLLQNMH